MKNMRIHYDEEADFFEITVGRPTKCIANEVEKGVFVRRDEKTNEVKSIGILNFKKKSAKGIEVPLQIYLKN